MTLTFLIVGESPLQLLNDEPTRRDRLPRGLRQQLAGTAHKQTVSPRFHRRQQTRPHTFGHLKPYGSTSGRWLSSP